MLLQIGFHGLPAFVVHGDADGDEALVAVFLFEFDVPGDLEFGVRPLALMYITVYIGSMAQKYSIAQARSSLPTIVDQAEAGQQVELTRRGKPVAIVVSLREFERLRGKRAGFGEAYLSFLENHSLGEVGVDEDFATSVRDRSTGRKAAV